MQNTSEQQHSAPRSTSAGTDAKFQPSNSKINFLLFMLAGFILMISIVFAGLYIDGIAAALLGREKEGLEAPKPPTRQQLDSMARAIQAPDDPGLTVREELILWLRADAITNVKDSATVAMVRDASTKHINALQEKPDAQPQYIAKGLNGKPVLRFDGTNDVYYLSSLTDSLTPATIYFVWQKPTSGGTPFQRIISSSSTGIDYMNKGAAFIPPTQNQGVGASPARIDTVTSQVMDLRNFYIGRLNMNTEQFYAGDLAEIIVYKRKIKPQEHEAIQAYLKKKYGL